MVAFARIGRDPNFFSIWIPKELAITEVASQFAELPEMIGNVFPDIANRAIRAHDYLLVFVGEFCLTLACRGRTTHHPASGILTLLFLGQHALFNHLLESQVPEM